MDMAPARAGVSAVSALSPVFSHLIFHRHKTWPRLKVKKTPSSAPLHHLKEMGSIYGGSLWCCYLKDASLQWPQNFGFQPVQVCPVSLLSLRVYRLESMVLEVFSDLSDSMVTSLRATAPFTQAFWKRVAVFWFVASGSTAIPWQLRGAQGVEWSWWVSLEGRCEWFLHCGLAWFG